MLDFKTIWNISNEDLPKNIDPCPINEVVFELGYFTEISQSSVFGLMYSKFKDRYPNASDVYIPASPRFTSGKNLSSNRDIIYRMNSKDEKLAIQISRNVIALNNLVYSGWDSLFKEINNLVSDTYELGFVNKINMIGLRYVNLFEDVNIFDELSLDIRFKNNMIVGNLIPDVVDFPISDSYFRVSLLNDDKRSIVQFMDKTPVSSKKAVSVFDISTYVDLSNVDSSKETICNKVNECHLQSKQIFFTFMSEEYLRSLKISK